MTEPLWTPSPERVEASHMLRLLRDVHARHGLPSLDYAALHRWSVDHLDTFWGEAWADAGVAVSAPHTTVLTERTMPLLREAPAEVWFPGTRFNFAQHLLRYRDERPALVAEGEATPRRTLSYAELYEQVAACAAGLQSLGVGVGDRVAGFLPNTIETVVAMLATTSLGAIWSSTSPDFGFQGVLDRFGQIDPTVLICADGYHYGGKTHDSLARAAHLREAIGPLEHLVVVPFVAADPELPSGAMTWDALLARGAPGGRAPEPPFAQLPFDHPVFIMYSSGTTGAPKCIVHGAGGTLLKHHVEHKFHTDLGRADALCYFTTCGWMMWNWLVTGLAQGCTVVLYDGSPGHPQPGRLWRLAADVGITVLGTSPKYLAACHKAGQQPSRDHDLAPLRAVLSTGSPLEPEQFDYVYESVKADVQLASIAGGTDIIGCFMLGNPLLPVYPAEIQGPALGVDLAAYDEAGQPVVGRKGELVCRQPIPSMPVHFWQDPGGTRFRRTYFETYPGVWRHGDYITITERGGVVVHGRSDATLNPGGVRIGTAEIYRIVEALPEVLDSIVVGRRVGGEQQVVLFVVLREGEALTPELAQRIRQAIRAQASPRHVPAHVRTISEVPVTINGKKVELAVTALLQGEAVTNRDALANPDSLNQFAHLDL